MITTTFILLVAALIFTEKKIGLYINSFKGLDFKAIANKLWDDIKRVALKSGRDLARMIVEMWYVISAEETPLTDKILIYAGFLYLVTPLNLMPTSIYKVFGVADEAAAIAIIYDRVKKNITPEIRDKARQVINDWFGYEIGIISDAENF